MIIPAKLKKGDEIRVISPARSLSIVGQLNTNSAVTNLQNHGYKITFGKNVREVDEFNSSSVMSRIEDLHEAFLDENVKGVFTVIGGYNSNQLLNYIDYELIKRNPKILCGFSDITALTNAITTMTGMITYSGIHFSTWAMQKGFEYNKEYFDKCLTSDIPFEISHSESWSDDPWYIDQENRNFVYDKEYWIINKGQGSGKIVGGHIRCLACLQGTKYMPSLSNTILFLEEDETTNGPLFDRMLQSIIHQKDFSGVKGIVIGRFQKKSGITKENISKIIRSKPELNHIPVVANADFGHTNPLFVFPIGGISSLSVTDDVRIEITTH